MARDEPRRKPDPERAGTVYRAKPRFSLGRGGYAGPGRPAPAPDGSPPPPEEWVDQPYVEQPWDDGPATPAQGPYGRPATPPPPSARYPGARPGGPDRPAPPPQGLRPAAPRPSRRRIRPGRWVVLLLVLALIVYPLALFFSAWTSLRRVDALGSTAALADTPGRTFLVVGSDSRADLTAAQRKELHTGKAAGQRTDTIMMLHVPDGGGPTVLVSIPRDSYVKIPGHGKNKINAAYAFGGPKLLVATVEQASGVRIDQYVETGLAQFAGLVDAIDGVSLCVPRAIDDAKAHIKVAKGCQDLDGKTALGYARARYSDPRGDLGRVERQRAVLAGIASKTLSPAVLLVPWRAFPASSAGGEALAIDQSAQPMDVARFVLAMRSVAGGKGLSLTVPIDNPDLPTPAGRAVSWDAQGSKQLFGALKADDTEAIRPIAAEQEKVAKKAAG